MAINVLVKVSRESFERVLKDRGWNKVRFNAREAFMKESEEWIWIGIWSEDLLTFVSFPKEEDSKLHSKGVKLLREEVKGIGKVLGFSLPEEVTPWNY